MHAQYKEEYHAYIVPFPFTKLLLTASLDQNVHEFIYCKKDLTFGKELPRDK